METGSSVGCDEPCRRRTQNRRSVRACAESPFRRIRRKWAWWRATTPSRLPVWQRSRDVGGRWESRTRRGRSCCCRPLCRARWAGSAMTSSGTCCREATAHARDVVSGNDNVVVGHTRSSSAVHHHRALYQPRTNQTRTDTLWGPSSLGLWPWPLTLFCV